MHTIEPTLAVSSQLPAVSRTAAAYDTTGVDLGLYQGNLHFLIDAGTFGGSATLDAKLQESDDNSTFTDVAAGTPSPSVAQMTAAGTRELAFRVRRFTKRYARLRVTIAVAAVVFSVALVAQPLKAE